MKKLVINAVPFFYIFAAEIEFRYGDSIIVYAVLKSIGVLIWKKFRR